jgi:hypothetical protein
MVQGVRLIGCISSALLLGSRGSWLASLAHKTTYVKLSAGLDAGGFNTHCHVRIPGSSPTSRGLDHRGLRYAIGPRITEHPTTPPPPMTASHPACSTAGPVLRTADRADTGVVAHLAQ